MLGNAVRTHRLNCEMTQMRLAELVGISRQTLISIENGRRYPSLLIAFRIVEALHVPFSEVFWYGGDTKRRRSRTPQPFDVH